MNANIYIKINWEKLKSERQVITLRQINLHNCVLSSDLSNEINVSGDTIKTEFE